MAGRPTLLTPERADDLVLLLSNGLSISSAARAAGRSMTTSSDSPLSIDPRPARRRQPRTVCSSGVCDDGLIQRFIVTIEGHGWSDFEEIELPQLPSEGEPIDTKFGTLLVERAETTPDGQKYNGKIVCRLP